PRGTLHLLPARELGLWNRALAAVPSAGGRHGDGVDLSPQQRDAVVEAVGDALADERLTLAQLDAAVAKRAGRWAGERVLPAFGERVARWRQAIAVAANRGVLCFGPDEGRARTYVHPRGWLDGVARVGERRALDELLRRYLGAYGPATPAQFARWLGTRTEWAAERFDALAGELEEIAVGGGSGWLLRDDAALPDDRPRSVRLLPYFDPFVVGCHPRERLFPPAAAARALRNGQAGNFPVLLIDGIVAGVWSQRRRGRRLDLTVEPLRRLPAVRRGPLEHEVGRVAAILEASAELRLDRVKIGGHG
ncbi:MAG TPA: winged helix DNA-binding domain-containing protein, partial [Conexibacter sp.]|nr:winged helix DNA-binding domain-containing protein [Conexibacter sp.]